MFFPTRYKLITLQKLSKESKKILNLHSKIKSLNFTDEDEGQYQQQSNEEGMKHAVTMEDAQLVAQVVTEIDIEQEKGVEALYYVLSIIQQGGSTEEALAYCSKNIKPVKKTKKKSL